MGYSQDSEIIPKTVEFCNKRRSDMENVCTRPIVTTSTDAMFQECIVTDDLIKKVTSVEWF